MKGNDRPDEGTRSPEWWIHLLGNLPAMLFLSAFSVLVYTFARIYHVCTNQLCKKGREGRTTLRWATCPSAFRLNPSALLLHVFSIQ